MRNLKYLKIEDLFRDPVFKILKIRSEEGIFDANIQDHFFVAKDRRLEDIRKLVLKIQIRTSCAESPMRQIFS